MKLVYDPQNDYKQLRALVRLLILEHDQLVVSGMSMRMDVTKKYGIDIDHHEFAYALDEMRTKGEVVYYSHNGGDTQYRVKPAKEAK